MLLQSSKWRKLRPPWKSISQKFAFNNAGKVAILQIAKKTFCCIGFVFLTLLGMCITVYYFLRILRIWLIKFPSGMDFAGFRKRWDSVLRLLVLFYLWSFKKTPFLQSSNRNATIDWHSFEITAEDFSWIVSHSWSIVNSFLLFTR